MLGPPLVILQSFSCHCNVLLLHKSFMPPMFRTILYTVYCMVENIGMELNSVVGKISHLSPILNQLIFITVYSALLPI